VTSTTATPDLRHNVAALGADYALFLIGLSFASQSTILPAFATHLGASNLVIGAIPALMTLGWFLPSLLAAHHTRTLPRKLPFVLRYTGAERVPFLILATLPSVAERAHGDPALMLVMLLVSPEQVAPDAVDGDHRAHPGAIARAILRPVEAAWRGVVGFVGSFGTYILGRSPLRPATACAFWPPPRAWGCRGSPSPSCGSRPR
jgi:hypothetical protein